MFAKEPEIATRWAREYGAKPNAKKKKKKFSDIAKEMK